MEKTRVVLVDCQSYEQATVENAVLRGVELLGGFGRFITPGEKILLKPNILAGKKPETCVITHPAVFESVAQALRKHGADIVYGDSPGGPQPASWALKPSGYERCAKALKIPFVDFDKGQGLSYLEGISSKRLIIANGVLATQGIVSLPKLKTHGLTRLTGAVKNQYGCVPGIVKGEYHARFPNVYDFAKLLVDITAFVKPRLYIMDAVMAMEGNGPQNGTPRKLGLLLLGTDPVAIDAVASRIIGLDPAFVPTALAGMEAGLGTYLEEEIELVGDPIDSFITSDFNVVKEPPVSLPKNRLAQSIKRLIISRPVIDKKRCTKCGRCIQVCPVDPKAVDWKNGQEKKRPPIYDYSQCIRCFCCHEMCPFSAITIRRPLLGHLLPIASYLSLLIAANNTKRHRRKK